MSIIVKNISKSYADTKIISGFSAVFDTGGHYAITGESGIGKTTLLHMLCGLIKQDSGQIIRDESKFSLVFQEDRLISEMSAVKNVQIFTNESRDVIIQNAERLGLTHADMYKKAAELSGGQRRRIAILRAVLAEGSALLMDEPFKGLDEANRDRAMSYITQRHKGLLILVTHDTVSTAMQKIVINKNNKSEDL